MADRETLMWLSRGRKNISLGAGTCSLHKYLLSSYYVLGAVDQAEEKTKKCSLSYWAFILVWETDNKQVNKYKEVFRHQSTKHQVDLIKYLIVND